MTFERSIQTIGIVLKHIKVGEFDTIVTLYSPSLGKIQAKAKGARKIEKSFCSQLEILNICLFNLYRKKDTFTVTQAIIEKNHKILRQNFETSILAFLILEIFQKITSQEEEINTKLFHLLTQTLESLEQNGQKFLIIEKFKLQLLHYNGVLPELTSCSTCNKKWDQKTPIYLGQDGHLNCCLFLKNSMPLDFNILKLLHFLLKYDLKNIKIALQENEKKQLKLVTNFFLRQYVGQDFQSEKILNQLIPEPYGL